MFDVTKRHSLGKLKTTWIPAYETEGMFPYTPVNILVGCKADLDASSREVPREEAEAFASSRGWLYAETSAKDGLGVSEAFERITAEVLSKPHLIEEVEQSKAAAHEAAERASALEEEEQQAHQGKNRSCNLGGCIVS